MGIGSRIKEYRSKCNLTQKELADRLHVTYQAVSKWENDDAEPSFDCLKEMTNIFGCSFDDLFGEQAPIIEEEEPKVIEKIVVQESKPVLALCEKCNKPIYDSADIHRFEKHEHHGRLTQTRAYLYCTECNNERLAEEQRQAEQRRQNEIDETRKRRKRSFIWPAIIAAVIIAIGAVVLGKGNQDGLYTIIVGIVSFPFAACLFLDNNFIGELWLEVASWGFVKMPGVIFQFSLGGFIIGIAIKIILWVLAILLAALVMFFATALGMFLSIFVYPFALAKNIREGRE